MQLQGWELSLVGQLPVTAFDEGLSDPTSPLPLRGAEGGAGHRAAQLELSGPLCLSVSVCVFLSVRLAGRKYG